MIKGKNGIYGFLFLLLLACEPGYTDELDGKWQLREVTQTDGSTHKVDTVWYNFQNTLFQYQFYIPKGPDGEGDVYHHWYGYKEKEDSQTLKLEFDTELAPVDHFLKSTDWSTSQRTFLIEKHSGNKLVLSSEGKLYHFRKF
ncbi:hypothetical protein D0T51_11070 [Parabacteroides sp. 52]|uniref:lipocalin-like domain-containing protein n=1 Tax=unclassified Parabacteroides TaxID=2649774 RepID=UPI0013D69793|nr:MULTISPECIES: lipocalin-like domain-containing protein [unclassified Parabacteroides]MDH6535670.1 hypothetical protein [Parabacteroides sp. PM5-20]NDV56267.1 hypothetical protein [Parabacteroides sp. 52]